MAKSTIDWQEWTRGLNDRIFSLFTKPTDNRSLRDGAEAFQCLVHFSSIVENVLQARPHLFTTAAKVVFS
jgi:hypothetical protein